jgi:uncharacterized membrane protein YdjX (TVP38/TMEM64 family)
MLPPDARAEMTASKKKPRIKKRWWISALAILTVLVLMARGVPVVEWLESLAGPFRDLGALGVVLYALCYFVAAMLCFPCMPLTLAAGYIFGALGGFLAVQTACTLAAACGFLAGRALGRKHVADRLRDSPRFHYLDGAIRKEGWKIVGLLRMHAIPFGLSNYLYGLTSIDFWHYLLATFFAMVPGHIIYTYLASLGERHLKGEADIGPVQYIAVALAIGSTILLTALLTRMVRRRGGLKAMA